MVLYTKYVFCPRCGKERLLFTQNENVPEPAKQLCYTCKKRKEVKRKERFATVASDIPAGGGATIDLFYDPNTRCFIEEKHFPSGEVQRRTIEREDFDADEYRLKEDELPEMR